MTNTTALDLDRLEALAKAMPPGQLHPYATAVGGVVILNGPFPKKHADRIVDFIAAANPAAILQLIADLHAALAAKGQQEPVAKLLFDVETRDELTDEQNRLLDQRQTLNELLVCFMSWEPQVCVLGNVRADKAAAAIRAVLAAPVAQQSEAAFAHISRGTEDEQLRSIDATLASEDNKYDCPGDIRFCGSVQSEAGAPTAAAEPTDLSKRLRGWDINSVATIVASDLHAAADEIERYYGGMMAWKKTAEKKDADWNAERMARIDERCAARAEAGRESAAPAAPVREGDREQEAKDAAIVSLLESAEGMLQWCVKNVNKWSFPNWDWLHADVEKVRRFYPIDAAMQKGAQQDD